MTDKEIADDYRMKLHALLQTVCDVMKEADKKGFQLGFNIANNELANITVAKKL